MLSRRRQRSSCAKMTSNNTTPKSGDRGASLLRGGAHPFAVDRMAGIGWGPLVRTRAATWPGRRPLTLRTVRLEGFDEARRPVRVHVATAASLGARIDEVRWVIFGEVDGRGIVATVVLTRNASLRVLKGGCVPRGKRAAIGSASEDGNRADEESHRTHLQGKPQSRQPSGVPAAFWLPKNAGLVEGGNRQSGRGRGDADASPTLGYGRQRPPPLPQRRQTLTSVSAAE
jgi:hypothetical protein